MSKKEIDAANEIHVIDYLETKGEPLKKEGSNYYRHAEHDSLVLREDGKWFWNSRSVGGFGAISLAREFYGMKFQEAVRDVNGLGITKKIDRASSFIKEEYIYPLEYEVKGIENAKNYLIHERKIDEKIVLALIKHDLIAEDKMKNLVFKWKDNEGNIVGADRQGTIKIDNKRGSFKKIDANSKADGGFTLDIGTPTKIAFFESPIDSISYYDLNRPTNIRLQSMSGLKEQTFVNHIKELAMECKQRGEKLEQVILAVDNDNAGREFTEKIENILGDDFMRKDIPLNKDWNDDLKEAKNNKEQFQSKVIPLQKKIAYQELER